jgi:hypothetical protein
MEYFVEHGGLDYIPYYGSSVCGILGSWVNLIDNSIHMDAIIGVMDNNTEASINSKIPT